ncbi:hypothetical protein Tco_0866817 [Tanacetum coccineum]
MENLKSFRRCLTRQEEDWTKSYEKNRQNNTLRFADASIRLKMLTTAWETHVPTRGIDCSRLQHHQSLELMLLYLYYSKNYQSFKAPVNPVYKDLQLVTEAVLLISRDSRFMVVIINKDLSDIEYDSLYDTLLQFEPHVQASKAKKAAKNHDPLSLIAYSNAYSSQSHASLSYSHSPQPYYVTHPSSVVDSEEDYQRELQGDVQEDKLTTAMMLLAREITQKLSTPTNNRLCTSSNTRNQAMINDGRVDIQTKNAGYGGNGNRNEGRQNRNQASNAGHGLVQQNDESNQIVQRVPRTESNPGRENVQSKVRDAKYFKEQMLLAMKDEAGGTLNEEENNSMLDNAYGDETLEELTVVVIMMVRIQPVDENTKTEPKYDAEAVTEVNASDAIVVRLQQEVLQLPRIGLLTFGDIQFLLVTLYTKLKILDSSFDDKNSCEHMKGHNKPNSNYYMMYKIQQSDIDNAMERRSKILRT